MSSSISIPFELRGERADGKQGGKGTRLFSFDLFKIVAVMHKWSFVDQIG